MRLSDLILILPEDIKNDIQQDLDRFSIDELCRIHQRLMEVKEEKDLKYDRLRQAIIDLEKNDIYTLDDIEKYKEISNELFVCKLYNESLNELIRNIELKIGDKFPIIKASFTVKTDKYLIHIKIRKVNDKNTPIAEIIEEISQEENV